MGNNWKWLVAGYYDNNVKPPKKPGKLAIEVKLMSDSAKDLEISILKKRKDIGRIIVRSNEDA